MGRRVDNLDRNSRKPCARFGGENGRLAGVGGGLPAGRPIAEAFGSRVVIVSGEARPIIFIPGLGCPGAIWSATVDHLGAAYQSHVLTLAGFAGQAPFKPPLAAKVRKELVRYIRSNKLKAPIIVGHSMGGFIAYWLGATAIGCARRHRRRRRRPGARRRHRGRDPVSQHLNAISATRFS